MSLKEKTRKYKHITRKRNVRLILYFTNLNQIFDVYIKGDTNKYVITF